MTMRNTTGPIAILERQPTILDTPMPPGLRRKVVGFAIGLGAALLLNVLVGPGSAAWRSSTVSVPSDSARWAAAPTNAAPAAASANAVPAAAPASAAPAAASAPAVAPSAPEAKPSPVAGSPDDGAPVADPPLRKAAAHKASRATKRHPPKHRVASRR